MCLLDNTFSKGDDFGKLQNNFYLRGSLYNVKVSVGMNL